MLLNYGELGTTEKYMARHKNMAHLACSRLKKAPYMYMHEVWLQEGNIGIRCQL
jgi:hypothetical protein